MGPPGQMNTHQYQRPGAITRRSSGTTSTATYGSFATYDIGKVLVAGGGDITEGGQSHVPTKTAVIVDVNGGSTTVSSTASMSVGRRQHNLTVLADGSVLATGGHEPIGQRTHRSQQPRVRRRAVGSSTETWTVLSSASRVRQYHSSATLLPDGRVLTGGGGVCASCVNAGYLEKNIEYFEPPYLYKKDGSGERASRPVIDVRTDHGQLWWKLDITSAQAGTIAKVGLVRLGATNSQPGSRTALYSVDLHRRRQHHHRHGASDLEHRASRLLHALHHR